MGNINIEKWKTLFFDYGTEYGLKLLGAVIIWIIGSWIIKKIKSLLQKAMNKFNYDESLEKFLTSLIIGSLKVILIILILGQLGVETSSFAAILAAAGLAIGLALQGSLSNFAGGILIMIFKPYRIGDYIQAQGESGTVKEIEIFTTKLNSTDNKEIIIPNGAISNGNITNFSTEKVRRVDVKIGVSYDADIKQTKELLLKIMTENTKILKDPEPLIVLSELGDSSVNFLMRSWVNTDEYWNVYFELLETSKIELDKAGIEIPFPQMDIHTKN
jgi:small conductance mechanosensitive channel